MITRGVRRLAKGEQALARSRRTPSPGRIKPSPTVSRHHPSVLNPLNRCQPATYITNHGAMRDQSSAPQPGGFVLQPVCQRTRHHSRQSTVATVSAPSYHRMRPDQGVSSAAIALFSSVFTTTNTPTVTPFGTRFQRTTRLLRTVFAGTKHRCARPQHPRVPRPLEYVIVSKHIDIWSMFNW